MCIPDPAKSVNGFGMNDARRPCSSATFDDEAERRDVVGGRQRIRVSQVDLLLARCPSWWLNSTEIPSFSSMVIAVRRKSLTATLGCVVEVADIVNRDRWLARSSGCSRSRSQRGRTRSRVV